MGQRIKLRRDTAANWTAINPILQAGEMGVEAVTNRMKVGDGVTVWTGLPYVGGGLVEGVNNFRNHTASTVQVVAHGLGKMPLFVEVVAECIVANSGYTVGQYVKYGNGQTIATYDSVNTYLTFSSATVPQSIVPRGGGAAVAAGVNNWRMRIRPFA